MNGSEKSYSRKVDSWFRGFVMLAEVSILELVATMIPN
jgi:hypothetical protein